MNIDENSALACRLGKDIQALHKLHTCVVLEIIALAILIVAVALVFGNVCLTAKHLADDNRQIAELVEMEGKA